MQRFAHLSCHLLPHLLSPCQLQASDQRRWGRWTPFLRPAGHLAPHTSRWQTNPRHMRTLQWNVCVSHDCPSCSMSLLPKSLLHRFQLCEAAGHHIRRCWYRVSGHRCRGDCRYLQVGTTIGRYLCDMVCSVHCGYSQLDAVLLLLHDDRESNWEWDRRWWQYGSVNFIVQQGALILFNLNF